MSPTFCRADRTPLSRPAVVGRRGPALIIVVRLCPIGWGRPGRPGRDLRSRAGCALNPGCWCVSGPRSHEVAVTIDYALGNHARGCELWPVGIRRVLRGRPGWPISAPGRGPGDAGARMTCGWGAGLRRLRRLAVPDLGSSTLGRAVLAELVTSHLARNEVRAARPAR